MPTFSGDQGSQDIHCLRDFIFSGEFHLVPKCVNCMLQLFFVYPEFATTAKSSALDTTLLAINASYNTYIFEDRRIGQVDLSDVVRVHFKFSVRAPIDI